MFCTNILNFLIRFLFAANLVIASSGSRVLWRYLVCKEAWPVVSHNEDAAPEPSASNSWPQPPPSVWAPERSRAARIWAGAAAPQAGPFSVWVPAASPETGGWARSAPASSNWVRTPTPSTTCSLLLDDDPTPTDAGCFEETNELDGALRIYCRLHCEQTPFGGEIFFIKEDSENTGCIKFVNYNVQLRQNDWYAWRSGSCLKQAIAFRGRCVPQEWSAPAPVPEPNDD